MNILPSKLNNRVVNEPTKFHSARSDFSLLKLTTRACTIKILLRTYAKYVFKHNKKTRNSEDTVQLCEGSKYREGERRKWEEYSPTSLLFTEYNQIHREIMQVVET